MSGILGRLADRTATNQHKFYIDTLAELSTLPTRENGTLIKGTADWCKSYIPAISSTCFVMETSQAFILTSNGWKEIICGCGGGGGGSSGGIGIDTKELLYYYTKEEILKLLANIWYVQSEECIYIRTNGTGSSGGGGSSDTTHYKCYKTITHDEWQLLVDSNSVDEEVLYVLIDDDEQDH